MASKPLLRKQEQPCSCVPACLRMVLAGLGNNLSEAYLFKTGWPLMNHLAILVQ